MESRLMMSPQKKNKLVTSINGTKYLFAWLITIGLVDSLKFEKLYFTENLYTVVSLYVSPGFKMVLGNEDSFGLSG